MGFKTKQNFIDIKNKIIIIDDKHNKYTTQFT